MYIVITGASRGIGSFLAWSLSQSQNVPVSKLYLIYRSSDKEMKKTVSRLTCDCEVFKCDVANEVEVSATFQKFPEIDVLINNAGTTCDSLVTKMSEEAWDKVLNVNLKGAFLCSKNAIPKMTRFGSQIINISSVLAKSGAYGAANYATSKGGLEAFTRSLSREVIKKGIFVNAIALGFFDIGLGLRLPTKVKQAAIQRTLMGTLGPPAEITKLVEYLINQRFMVGQVLHLNGGYEI